MKKLYVSLIIFLIWGSLLYAVDYKQTVEITPQITIGNVSHVSKMEIKYRLYSLMGEPVINGVWKWEGSEDQKFSYDTFVLLKFWESYGKGGKQYNINIKPTIPKAGKGYGLNVSGSPSWNKTLCKTQENGKCIDYWPTSEAKAFFKSFPPKLQEVWVWSSGNLYGPFTPTEKK